MWKRVEAQSVRELQDEEDTYILRILKQRACPNCDLFVSDEDHRLVGPDGQYSHASPHDCEIAGVRSIMET